MSINFHFIHLRTHTAYSLLEGAIQPKALVKLCKQHEMPAVAITDSNNLFGSLELSSALASEGIQPIIGCVLSFKPHPAEGMRSNSKKPPAPEQLVLLAQNETGYANLLKLVSAAYLHPADNMPPLLDYAQLDGLTDGLLCLTGGSQGGLAQLLLQARQEKAEQFLSQLQQWFPNRLYIEIQRHGMEAEKASESGLLDLAYARNLPLVATNDVYFAKREMFEAHDALMCIAEGTYVSESDRRKVTPEHYFKSAEEMAKLFADLPEAIANTAQIAKRCAVMSTKRDPILPRFGDIEEERQMLRERARAGLEDKLQQHVLRLEYGEEKNATLRKEYEERLEYELGVINQMGFPGYFLIVSDFISWAKSQGIPVGPGRGSGAGSLVAWALLITDLDPIRFGLLFERFLNPERVSMPDFDIDFCQDRRDEVITYVQQKYGREQVAQIITFGKLQARAVLRDVGRVLQLPYNQVDRICKLVPNNPAAPMTLQEALDAEPALRQARDEDEATIKMVNIALQLEGLYRHASTHAAGVVIGDRPLVELVPMYQDPKSNMLVVQYSMKYAELAGLVKFDFLGLKTLTVLQTACNMLAEQGVRIDLLKLPEGDKATYELLSRGDTTGVFQLESAGMRDTLRKLKPDSIEDIIALVSLYRPGPMDNIPTYIARKHGHEKAEYLHPKLEESLKETFGVIIYQEQVMDIARRLANYSLGEADLLRRAMGKKIASEMEAQRNIFTERAVGNGVEAKTAKAIYDLIAKFASYGFNKSHAAAYALIAYQTAYLKANYPAEFYAATMTYEMNNTDKLALFVDEAIRSGIAVLPPDINQSFPDFRVEAVVSRQSSVVSNTDNRQLTTDNCKAIRYALGALKNVGEAAMNTAVQEREKNGAYQDIFDFASRLDSKVLNKRQMEQLIKAGAFDSLHKNRRQLFDGLEMVMSYSASANREREDAQVSLFASATDLVTAPKPKLPELPDWPTTEKLGLECEAVGFYLQEHPLKAYEVHLQSMQVSSAADLPRKLGSEYSAIRIAGIVGSVKQRRSQKGRFAFVSLSDQSGAYEVSIFDETLLDSSRELLESGTLVFIKGEGKKEEAGMRLIARSIQRIDEAVSSTSRGELPPLTLTISDSNAAKSIKQLLPAPSPRGAKISFKIALNGSKTAIIELAGRYPLTPPLMEELQRIIHS
jgi:DNA polymerase-3 subunit alpha